jgi:phage terminase small subunit
MPVLKNAKHERFAQAISEGKSNAEAYVWAGYETNANAAAVSANRLLKDAKISGRIAELLKRREDIEVRATEKAVDKLAISKERILSELAKIGFADIRKAVKWGHRQLDDEGDAGEVKFTNDVAILPSEEIDDETAGAIAEISETQNGIKVKLHDKRAALVDMGKHLGIFKDVHEHTGPGGGPVQLQRIERIIVDTADQDPPSVPAPAGKPAVQGGKGRSRRG